VLAGTWCAAPALAHKVVVFATGAGKAIEGEVYFHGGEPAREAKVTLLGPDDQVLGQTTTDQEGKFRVPIRFRCDYRVVADAGAGHGAQYTVPADELAADLPPLGDKNAQPNGRPAAGTIGTTGEQSAGAETAPDLSAEAGATPEVRVNQAHQSAASQDAAPPAPQPKRVRVSADQSVPAELEAVAKQVAAMRSDLQKYRNDLHLRDLLGGIGYILGIMGIAFYFLGVRRKEKRSAIPDS
jgi:nickel transport protein